MLQHWNGNQLCAIDILTTGDDPLVYEICEISILPLDHNLEPRKDVMPAYMFVRPIDTQCVDYATTPLTPGKYAEILQKAIASTQVAVIIENWWRDRLNLGNNKFGNPRKIIPLVYDAQYAIPFLRRFFGPTLYAEMFRPEVRDLLSTATFLSDHHGFHCKPVLTGTGKCQWNYICNKYKGVARLQKGALQRALAMSQAYKTMVNGMNLFAT